MKILVTGVASGIGLEIAQSLINVGHEVIGIDCKSKQSLNILYHQVDLSNLEEVLAFTQQQSDAYDALIYCAGIREICNPIFLSLEEWNRTMNVNVNAYFFLAQSCIKEAIEENRPFNIISIASISGLQVEADRAAYVTSKFALIGLTRQLAFQYGRNGIRANAIAPGIIETPLTADYFKDSVLVEKIKDSIPLGYWGQVKDIVPLVDLCLNNSYMNGSVLVCDGGWTTGKSI